MLGPFLFLKKYYNKYENKNMEYNKEENKNIFYR